MPKATDLSVQYLPLADLLPYARNARTHDDAQVAQIASSIKEFGFCNPILIDKDKSIIAGHGRALAAHKLGLTDVPTIQLGHLSDTQKKAYVIADNRLALNAGWDIGLLSLELQELKTDFNLDLLGFDDKELTSMLDGPPVEPVPDGVVEGQKEFLLVIECETEEHQRDLFEELKIRELKCKIM